MMKPIAFSLAAILLGAGLAQAVPINQVAPATLTLTEVITFDDVPGGPSPGTNYDSILALNGASFAEHFAGQVVTHNSGDVLSGLPEGPLTLQAGDPSQNLNVFLYNGTTNVLDGLGKTREDFPVERTIGEGAFAVLFQQNQTALSFDLVGGNVGQAFVSFFGRDGSLIEAITLSGLSDQSYGFVRDGGVWDIAGFSVYNNDPAGISIDNLRFDAPATSVPEPSTLIIVGSGLLGMVVLRRRAMRA